MEGGATGALAALHGKQWLTFSLISELKRSEVGVLLYSN